MSTAQKTPLSRTLNQFAQAKAVSEIRKRGLALPGHVKSISGQIVTVNFDVSGATLPLVQMPIATPEYIRLPIQVGDLGVAFPADTTLAYIAGLGATPAALDVLQGNLSTLLWFPVSSAKWSTTDANAVTIYGPNGVVLRDSGATTSITLTPGEISMSAGGHTIVISSAGVVIDGKTFLTHAHTGVTTGSSDTGAVA